MEEVVTAEGHPNVRATHRSTLEVTADDHLTRSGDCIVGVRADRPPVSFDRPFVHACQHGAASITARLEIDERSTVISGRGSSELTFADPTSMVIRTSTYVDDRTIMIEADRAAGDLDRELVIDLQHGAPLTLTLSVDP